MPGLLPTNHSTSPPPAGSPLSLNLTHLPHLSPSPSAGRLLQVPEEHEVASGVSCRWVQVAAQGSAPVARNSHCACIIESGQLAGRMVVIGGSNEEGPLASIQLADMSGLADAAPFVSWSTASHPSHSRMAPREMHAGICIGSIPARALLLIHPRVFSARARRLVCGAAALL
jgi:hypothetical protein